MGKIILNNSRTAGNANQDQASASDFVGMVIEEMFLDKPGHPYRPMLPDSYFFGSDKKSKVQDHESEDGESIDKGREYRLPG